MRKRITILSLLVLILSIFGIDTDLLNNDISDFSSEVLSDSEEQLRVARVIDGDTIVLENGNRVATLGSIRQKPDRVKVPSVILKPPRKETVSL